MSLVFEDLAKAPGTHALVIGIGAYAHLLQGSGALYPNHGGMGQLKSPPFSARAFAAWLLSGFRNPEKPLASVDILFSDASTERFVAPGGREFIIEKASMANVSNAIFRWEERGNSNPDNLMVFFFCGHGIAKGLTVTLLLEDFGERDVAPFNQAIDFSRLHLGMDKCRARQQCYFIDACRVASSELIETDFAGEPIISPSLRHSPAGMRHAPIYYATVAGSAAYGRADAPSVFTQALLSALVGAGSDDAENEWRVYTDTLNLGIDFVMKREIQKEDILDQVSSVDHLTRFTLHCLEGKPMVPVSVSCEPKEANAKAEMGYSCGQHMVQRKNTGPSEWHVDIEEGKYSFFAKFSDLVRDRYRDNRISRYVRPPFRYVPIKVKP